MDVVTDIAQACLTWGRWGLVAVLVVGVVYRNRVHVRPAKLARELVLVVVAYFAYFLVRGATEGSESRALANARDLVQLERGLGIFWEPELQRLIVDHDWMVTLANWTYIWGHWPMIAIVAMWLYLNRPGTYNVFRNAFMISGAIGLVIFMLYPVAPPRLAELEVIDTVTEHSRAYRVLQPPALVNQYAAVPSLHFGWNLLIGIALLRESRSTLMRGFAVVLPVVMLLSIILTANHYILDAAAGAAVALFGLAAAEALAAGVSRARFADLPSGLGEARS